MRFKTPYMMAWEKKYPTCKHEFKSDFSHFTSWESNEKEPHFYCPDCHTHWYKGKEWNPNEWDEYVNDC